MLTRFMIPLSQDERAALVQLADTEARDPRRQAALIIRQKLEELGLIAPKPLAQAATDTTADNPACK